MASNILIIEPNETINQAMCERLRAFGFSVQSAVSLADAMQVAATLHPDLVVVDHCLANPATVLDPSMDSQWLKDAALVLVAESEDAAAAMSVDSIGASSLLTQPMCGNELLDSVSHALWHGQAAANDADWVEQDA